MTDSILAIEVETPGAPEAMRRVRKPMPVPGPGEVLVRAEAIGVSSADMMIRKGLYNWMPPLPVIPGNELAGQVVAVGGGVDTVLLGTRVLVSSRELPYRGGCYAEVVCVPADTLFELPPNISARDAVALPNYQLAWALLHASGVREPSSIVVHGAAGGVGLALSQLALAEGIECIGLVSTEEKRAFLRAAGVDKVLLRSEDVRDGVLALTAGRGVDVVYAHAGPQLVDNLDLLAPLGTVISFSILGGPMPEADLFGALRARFGKSLGIRVYSLHTLDSDKTTRRAAMRRVIELMAAERLRPPAPMLWPLEKAVEAHDAMEQGQSVGKVILVP